MVLLISAILWYDIRISTVRVHNYNIYCICGKLIMYVYIVITMYCITVFRLAIASYYNYNVAAGCENSILASYSKSS